MTRLILALIRSLALLLSYALSTFAASVFLTFALFLGANAQWLEQDPAVAVGAAGFTIAMWITVASTAMIPFLVVVAVAEFARLSSLLANLVGGGLCAVAVMILLPPAGDALPYPMRDIWLAAIAAGFAGGLAHWLLAGHRAGRWLGPQREQT